MGTRRKTGRDRNPTTDYLKSLNEDDTVTDETLEELPTTENEKEEGWIKQLRLRLRTHRISHGINKLTASKWESVWADANPIGNEKCRKEGIGRMKCLACGLTTDEMKTRETARHDHLSCPMTKRALGMVYRCYINQTATNLTTIEINTQQALLSPHECIRAACGHQGSM